MRLLLNYAESELDHDVMAALFIMYLDRKSLGCTHCETDGVTTMSFLLLKKKGHGSLYLMNIQEQGVPRVYAEDLFNCVRSLL